MDSAFLAPLSHTEAGEASEKVDRWNWYAESNYSAWIWFHKRQAWNIQIIGGDKQQTRGYCKSRKKHRDVAEQTILFCDITFIMYGDDSFAKWRIWGIKMSKFNKFMESRKNILGFIRCNQRDLFRNKSSNYYKT